MVLCDNSLHDSNKDSLHFKDTAATEVNAIPVIVEDGQSVEGKIIANDYSPCILCATEC